MRCVCINGFNGNGFICTSMFHIISSIILQPLPLSYSLVLFPDVNECSEGIDNCHTNAVCTDTTGSFQCTCSSGFTGDGTTCTSILLHALGSPCVEKPLHYIVLSISDINECGQGTDNCHANAQCTDTVGSFQCDCLPGFEGNGVTCNGKVFCPCYVCCLRLISVLYLFRH